jgi:ankyrin repeat protein
MSSDIPALPKWIESASLTEFTDRIDAEPGLLSVRDSHGDGFALLHHVAALGRIDLLNVILERGLSVDLPSGAPEEYPDNEEAPRFDPGYTPLMSAAAYGQLAAVKRLLFAGAHPMQTDYHHGTALHSAAASGSVPILNVLLAAGCDPDAECDYKANSEELGFYWVGTPLHIAARSDHANAAGTLIGHGATVDALGMLDERRPLHYAAAYGAASALQALLRAGADPNRAEVFHGLTPLHYAASDGHVECVALLLRHGADPGKRLRETGHTPLELARDFHISERAEAVCRLLRSAD